MFRKTIIATLQFLKVIADYWLDVLEVDRGCSLQGGEMQSLIGNSMHPILIVDNDLSIKGLRCLYVSQCWLKIWKIEEREVLGVSLYELLPIFYDKWRGEHRQCILEGKIIANNYSETLVFKGKDYSIYWQLRPWYCDDSVTGMIIEILDYTECYKLSKQVKTTEKTNGILLATIAHQIKSRCRNMLLRAQNRESITDSLESLGEVTDNLIQLGKASNTDCQERVNLKALINQIVLDRKFEDFVKLDLADLFFRGSKKLMGEVFYELLHNANKYKKGILKVEVVGRYAKEGNRYLLTFKDYGIGIPKKKIPLLGTPFFRLHREIDGTGLGITFIQLVCEKHDIYCSYDSEYTESTTVSLLFKNIIHEKTNSTITVIR